MNRTFVTGVGIFVALVGIAMFGGEQRAVAGHGCHGCNGCDGAACHGVSDCCGDVVVDCCGCHGKKRRCHGLARRLRKHRCHGRVRCHGRRRCHGVSDCCGVVPDCCGEVVVPDCCGCHGGEVEVHDHEEEAPQPIDSAKIRNGFGRVPYAFRSVSFRR